MVTKQALIRSVCQLLKGVFQLRPPQPRYATTWQVSKVVQYISSLGSNSNLSTKLLSYKLVGLLALTAPDRASGLAPRDLRFRYFHPEGVQFKLPELTKTARQGQDPKSCFHASFPENEHLCVCKCLHEYEARTLQWRPQDPSKPNKLLLSHINPHKPVSPATLARWLKELMQLAGVDTLYLRVTQCVGLLLQRRQNRVFLSLTFCSLLTGLKRAPSLSFITDLNLTLLQGGQSYQVPRKFSTSAALNMHC